VVILLVVVTFAVFIVVDLIREHRRNLALLEEGESLHSRVWTAEPVTVSGFLMPPWLRYHQGHMWVHQVGPDLAYVGIDDFARRLTGDNARLTVPPLGTCVTAGQAAVGFEKNGFRTRLLSPVGGEIVGVNPQIRKSPDLPHQDCYGRGWIYKIRSPHLFKDLSNLLSGSLAQRWMEDTREKFQYRLMQATGTVLQDGGSPVEDMATVLPREYWRALVVEFLTLGQVSE
jgi:glycine cleavage system H protein